MQFAAMMLGGLLLAQTSDGGHPIRPPEIVAEAMLLPAGNALTGQPYTLLSAIGSTTDRRGQLEAAHAYWRLVEAVADYRFCLDHIQAFERIKTGGRNEASLRLAKATATARLQETQLAAVQAQHDLAAAVRLPAAGPLPLPADRPFVGAYRTSYKELFAARTPPGHARLAEKILPLEREAIDARAAAVQAADDVAIAAMDDYRGGRGPAAVVVERNRELLRQQQAFIQLVCHYNHNIADYGLMVVGPDMTPSALVAVLIGPPRPTGAASISGNDRPERTAGAEEPITTNSMPTLGRNEPTLAPTLPKKNEPTLAPTLDERKANQLRNERNESKAGARYGVPGQNKSAVPAGGPSSLKPLGRDAPSLEPLDGSHGAPSLAGESKVVPLDSLPPASAVSGEIPRLANKPPMTLDNEIKTSPLTFGEARGDIKKTTARDLGEAKVASPATPRYAALADVAPAARAKQLAVALHDNRTLPKDAGSPIRLSDCLLRDAGGDRRATIEAYWLVRQRTAEYQVLAGQVELLDGLVPAVLERRSQPTGAADMLRLHSAQLNGRAALREAQIALIKSQYALALRIGALAETAWPLASTSPHTGSYLLKLEAQPRGLAESWPVRRLAATLPGLGENVQSRAAMAIEADAARAETVQQYTSGGATIDQTLGAIAEQAEQTTAFLVSLTDYNRAIAEYATTVLPAGTPSDKLAAALVTKP